MAISNISPDQSLYVHTRLRKMFMCLNVSLTSLISFYVLKRNFVANYKEKTCCPKDSTDVIPFNVLEKVYVTNSRKTF